MPDCNAIVVCATRNWLPLAAATLLSCAEQQGKQEADLYAVLFEVTPADKEQLTAFLATRGVKAEIVDGVLIPPFQAMWDANLINPAILLRLLLDRYVPHHYDRVLYLDSDILALRPLDQVFHAELNSMALGAVEDWVSMPGPLRRFDDHPGRIGLPKGKRYFNAGMLLFDWQQTLRENLLPKSVDLWLTGLQQGKKFPMVDQDALNLTFQGNWQPLPITMNTSAVMVDYFPEAPILRHFSGHCRPWKNIRLPGLQSYREKYRALLAGHPWTEFQIEDPTATTFADLAGYCIRKVDFITRNRYRRHVQAGLANIPSATGNPVSLQS